MPKVGTMGPSTQWVDFSRSPTCACTTLLTYGNAEHDSGPAPCKTGARDECGHPRCAESPLVMNVFWPSRGSRRYRKMAQLGVLLPRPGSSHKTGKNHSSRAAILHTQHPRVHHERPFCTRGRLGRRPHPLFESASSAAASLSGPNNRSRRSLRLWIPFSERARRRSPRLASKSAANSS